MPTVIINKFDGGHAEDIRTFATDECEKTLNFDIFTNPHKLIPYGDSIAETLASGAMADIQISDIDYNLIGSSYLLRGIGNETNVSAKPTFWAKSAIPGAVNWSSDAVAAGNTFQKGSGIVYQTKFHALGFNGSNQYSLYRYNSAGSVTTIGTISASSTFYARPILHPSDKKMYGVIGTVIFQYDGTNLYSTGAGISLTLPSDYECTSLTDYGDYLAICMRPLRGNGNSIVYLWDRQLTLVDANTAIDFGEGNLVILENLNNRLIGILVPQNNSTTTVGKVSIRQYSGGSVETIKTIYQSIALNLRPIKQKNDGKLYFGFDNDYAVYVFGKNKEGNYIVTQDRFYNNGTIIGSALYALQIIGDILWRGFSTASSAYILMRSLLTSGESITYTSTSIYKTTINPNMLLSDRGKMKKLIAVRIYYTGKASGTVAVKYAVDTATMTSILSETTTAIEDMKQTTGQADNQAFIEGREIQFQLESTGGVEIKGVEYDYQTLNQ